MLYDYGVPFLVWLRNQTQRFIDFQDRWIETLIDGSCADYSDYWVSDLPVSD